MSQPRWNPRQQQRQQDSASPLRTPMVFGQEEYRSRQTGGGGGGVGQNVRFSSTNPIAPSYMRKHSSSPNNQISLNNVSRRQPSNDISAAAVGNQTFNAGKFQRLVRELENSPQLYEAVLVTGISQGTQRSFFKQYLLPVIEGQYLLNLLFSSTSNWLIAIVSSDYSDKGRKTSSNTSFHDIISR